jgi:hypothetical protein
MVMFSKDKPTKKVEFEGGWVELQFLSKGVKDEITSRLTSMFVGVDNEALKKIDFDKKDEIPTAMIGVVGKVNEVENYTLSKAIRAWSAADVAITEETVKDLDDEVFTMISKEANKMNELGKTEEKN